MANQNLQNALHNAGLTLEEFAEIIRVDPKTVQRWVTGNTTPYPKHRAAISHALNLSERELWPEQTRGAPTDGATPRPSEGRCDVVGTWGYADDPAAPDLVAFITDTDGPIDLYNSVAAFASTPEFTAALAARAAGGQPVRILTNATGPALTSLTGQTGIEILHNDIDFDCWFMQAGNLMLLSINFAEDTEILAPPIVELDGNVSGGLFDRLHDKFQELWDAAQDHQMPYGQTEGDEATDTEQDAPAGSSQAPVSGLPPGTTPHMADNAARSARRWPRQPS